MNRHDPTARAAIRACDNDVLGWALGRLGGVEACLVVLHHAFEVPVAQLVRQYKAILDRVIPNFDYFGHMHHMLANASRQLGDLVEQRGLALEDVDWHSSHEVRQIGARYGVHKFSPCMHCKQLKVPVIKLHGGRPRLYCSDSCRQAAYRWRLSQPSV